jgi:CelD/BcsL family acetyltransferase involved in cellulose biosynthesis
MYFPAVTTLPKVPAVSARAGAALRVRTFRSPEELESIREQWEQLQGDLVTTDIDHYLTVLRARPDVIRPHVVLVEEDGEPRALAVARVEEIQLSAKVAYLKIYAPRVRALTVVYGGVVGDRSEATTSVLFDELRAALARGEADVLRLRKVPLDSSLSRLARTSVPFLSRQHGSAVTLHWRAEIPDSFDEYLRRRSRGIRRNIRRYGNRLNEAYGDRLSLEVFRDEADLERLFRDTEAVAEKTYQAAMGASFEDDELRRSLTRLAMRRGWFRGYVLYLDGEACAFWYGLGYRGVFSTDITGYNPAYSDLRIGRYVMVKLIEDLCADETIHALDYGFGDAEYKRLFGDRQWSEEDVLVYAPRARAVWINLVRTLVLGLSAAARAVVGNRQVVDRLKRRWRARLASGESST